MAEPTQRINQKQKLEITESVLDDYERKLGLPKNISPGTVDELNEYLTMDRTTIESASPERLKSIAIRLAQFNIYIQRCINRANAINTWAEHQLHNVIANDLAQFNGDKFLKAETKIAIVSKNNVGAREINDINMYAKMTIDRLKDVAIGIKNLSYVISLAANRGKNE